MLYFQIPFPIFGVTKLSFDIALSLPMTGVGLLYNHCFRMQSKQIVSRLASLLLTFLSKI